MSGITFRGFRPSDVEAVVGLINACNEADDRSVRETVESFELDSSDPAIQAERHSLVAEADGRIVGYARLYREKGVRLVAPLSVQPSWRGQGIERSLIERVQAAASDFAEPVLDVPVRGQTSYAHALHELGFRPVRSWWTMRIDLSRELRLPVFPAGVELRSFVPGQDERMLTELVNDVFSDHWGEGLHTMEEIEHDVALPFFSADLLLFAEKDGQAIGYVWSWVHPQSVTGTGDVCAHIGDLGVRKAFRGQGLGRALLLRALLDIRARGVAAAELGVDAPNAPARHLYESVGFQPQQELRWYRKELRPEQPDASARARTNC
jgi:mycothiol synthase